ncbi:hypothetical protein DERF_002991, partial [Dermatophagoides farinae]
MMVMIKSPSKDYRTSGFSPDMSGISQKEINNHHKLLRIKF